MPQPNQQEERPDADPTATPPASDVGRFEAEADEGHDEDEEESVRLEQEAAREEHQEVEEERGPPPHGKL
jgi:hypothetical protein